eukprot:16189943-Heterocapsa_arctica.AAC.1
MACSGSCMGVGSPSASFQPGDDWARYPPRPKHQLSRVNLEEWDRLQSDDGSWQGVSSVRIPPGLAPDVCAGGSGQVACARSPLWLASEAGNAQLGDARP